MDFSKCNLFFHHLLLLINFLFNLDKGKGPMLLFSVLHNTVLFVLTFNAKECQKSKKILV